MKLIFPVQSRIIRENGSQLTNLIVMLYMRLKLFILRYFESPLFKDRLKKCREFVQLPIIDKVRPTEKKMLFLEGKTTFAWVGEKHG